MDIETIKTNEGNRVNEMMKDPFSSEIA